MSCELSFPESLDWLHLSDRLRSRRNQAEYPDPTGYDPITAAGAEEEIEAAVNCISSAERLLQLDELGVF